MPESSSIAISPAMDSSAEGPPAAQAASGGCFYSIKCHDRPVTELRFNRDGDLIFTAGKDTVVNLLRPDGSILGAYDKHEGSVLALAIDNESESLMTGSSDQSLILWDVATGRARNQANIRAIPRGLDFFRDGMKCLVCNDDSMNRVPAVGVFDTRSNRTEASVSTSTIPTKILLDLTENTIVFSDIEGMVTRMDVRIMKDIQREKVHTSKINNLRASRCKSFFVTASSDSQAKIVDFGDLSVQKTFVCEEPVNCAVIFNTNDKLVCVGGIEARDVTTTKGRSSFEANFFDVVTARKIGSYATHFGTINSVDVHPSGRVYCSGGEEGTVSIIAFGEDFFEAEFSKFD
jgi:translation initiation factor 3 subunit I